MTTAVEKTDLKNRIKRLARGEESITADEARALEAQLRTGMFGFSDIDLVWTYWAQVYERVTGEPRPEETYEERFGISARNI